MTKFPGDGSVKLWTCMIKGYMKFYWTGVLANVGAVNPCVKSKTNHLHANTGVRKSISDSRTLHWLTQVATISSQILSFEVTIIFQNYACTTFALKMLSAYYICYIYSNVHKFTFYHGSKHYES